MLLFDLLPRTRATPQPRLSVAELAAMLRALPRSDTPQALRRLMSHLDLVARAKPSLRNRLAMVELVREAAEPLRREVEEEIADSGLPLPSPLQRKAFALRRLIKRLTNEYESMARQLCGRWIVLGLEEQRHLATVRAMQLIARRTLLSYRLYRRPSSAVWSSLHDLYTLARRCGFSAQALAGETASPKRVFIDALLHGMADPARLGPRQLDWASGFIARYGRLVRLKPIEKGEVPAALAGSFLVRRRSDHPGRPAVVANGGVAGEGDFLLDCTDLLRKLDAQMQGLRQGIGARQLGLPQLADRADYAGLLRRLNEMWTSPPQRRHRRAHFHPRVDLVAGLERIWDLLVQAPSPGRARHTVQQEVVRGPGWSEWTVINESPTGFALRNGSGDTSQVRIGEILAVRNRDRAGLHLGIGRRALHLGGTDVELGLETLGPQAVALLVPMSDRARTKVIFVPRLAAYDNAPGLIVPPDRLTVGKVVRARKGGVQLNLKVIRQVERTDSCEIYLLSASAS
ncbi:MAG: hypothetical protein HY778_05730 [Betaproteobacteria bacterium]|nr:hypothetical protein [Betaproteobacteria bacterium]